MKTLFLAQVIGKDPVFFIVSILLLRVIFKITFTKYSSKLTVFPFPRQFCCGL